MSKTRVTIEGDLTVRMVKNLLEGLPATWRLVGQEDGSIVAAPGRRATRLDIEEEEVEDPVDAGWAEGWNEEMEGQATDDED